MICLINHQKKFFAKKILKEFKIHYGKPKPRTKIFDDNGFVVKVKTVESDKIKIVFSEFVRKRVSKPT